MFSSGILKMKREWETKKNRVTGKKLTKCLIRPSFTFHLYHGLHSGAGQEDQTLIRQQDWTGGSDRRIGQGIGQEKWIGESDGDQTGRLDRGIGLEDRTAGLDRESDRGSDRGLEQGDWQRWVQIIVFEVNYFQNTKLDLNPKSIYASPSWVLSLL